MPQMIIYVHIHTQMPSIRADFWHKKSIRFGTSYVTWIQERISDARMIRGA